VSEAEKMLDKDISDNMAIGKFGGEAILTKYVPPFFLAQVYYHLNCGDWVALLHNCLKLLSVNFC